MLDLPDPGLYRTTEPMPGNEAAFPAGVLVYVGQPRNGGVKFVVRPGDPCAVVDLTLCKLSI
jgi:hypothetical protein